MATVDVTQDLKRAEEAMEAAVRNLVDGDFLTAANRLFVACENTAYVILKTKFGSTSVSRKRILIKLKEINPKLKLIYDQAYDLRVQADYGRKAMLIPLNKENVSKTVDEMSNLFSEIKRMYCF